MDSGWVIRKTLSNIKLMYFAKDILNSTLKLNVYQTCFAFDDWKSYDGAYVANFNKNLI